MTAILDHFSVPAPDPRRLFGDFVEVSAGGHAERHRFGDVRVGIRKLVSFLEQKPMTLVGGTAPGSFTNQHPASLKLAAVQMKLQMTVAIVLPRVTVWLPGALVPEEHRAPAIFALRDDSLEASVFDRMVLDMHGQPLGRRVQTRPLGYCPALENPVELQPKIIVQVGGRVFLDDEAQLVALADAAPLRLARDFEITLSAVFRQGCRILSPGDVIAWHGNVTVIPPRLRC